MAISLRLTGKDAGASKGKTPVVEKPPLRDATAGEFGAAVGKNRRILVVDDNPVVLKAFEIKLKGSGFEVITATNGATVASTAERTGPALIILDINFAPGEDTVEWTGFTIMQWLRRFPDLAKIPVIMITGADAKLHQQQALAAGAVALFQKPVDYQQLLPTILQALGDSAPPVAEPPAKA